ncbi:MAG: hypothetical protein WCC00_02535 [Candidatus Aminicenantales bacterium]
MRAWRLTVGLAALVLTLSVAMPAQELSLSVGAGGLFPPSGDYRDIYGSGLSIGADVWLKLKGHFGCAAGFGLLSDRGMAVLSGPGTAEYPLSFRRTSIPVVVFYQVYAGPLALRFGAGAGFHSYRETWRTVDLRYDGHRISPRIVMTASLALIGRISIFCSAGYDSIRAGADSALGTTVNIGGLQLLGGLGFRIF